MRKLILFCLAATLVFGQGGRPPIDKYSQLTDVDVTGLAINNIMLWNGVVWVPGSAPGGSGLPSIVGQGGKFLTTDASTVFWGVVPFSSLSAKPTTAAGYGITGGANIDLWGAKTPYLGTLSIASGKTATFSNSVTFAGIDGASLNIGSGGTLGTNAFNSTAFALQSFTVNGHPLSSSVVVTKTDLGLGYILSGAGSPEGAVAAPIGSIYSRTDGSVGATLYIKQTGTGNTGWSSAGSGTGGMPTGGVVGQVLVKNSSSDYDASWSTDPGAPSGGSGTVLDVGVTPTNGVSAITDNATDHPRMRFSLGAITPSSVASTGTVTGSNLSGTNSGDQTITLTGPVTGSGTGGIATTITDGSVTIAKIAGIPTNTILGNNSALIATPAALTALQTKTILALNNVENTALSSWAGSTNLTTLAPASVTYGEMQNVTPGKLLGRYAAAVSGVSAPQEISTGSGLTLNTSTGVLDASTQTSADIFTNAGSSVAPAPWPVTPTPRTFISESQALSQDRFATLPAANLYPSGAIITYLDNVTLISAGRNFHPTGTDTLNGQNATTMGTTWFRPFIAGGVSPGSGTQQFKTDGTSAWVSIYMPSRAIKIQSPTDATKQVFFNVEDPGFSGTNYTITPATTANSVTVAPQIDPVPPGQAVVNVGSNGALAYTQVVPNPTTEVDGRVLTVVNPDGVSGTWAAQPVAQAIAPWVDLCTTPAGNCGSSPIKWAPISGQGQQNAFMTISANRTLKIAGAGLQAGQTFNLLVLQDSTTCPSGCTLTFETLNQYQYFTPSGGASKIAQTLVGGALDFYEIKYTGQNTSPYPFFPFIVTNVKLNLTALPAPILCNTQWSPVPGATTGTIAVKIGDIAQSKYKAGAFVATETSICRVEANLYKVVGTTGPNYPLHAEIHPDAVRLGGTYTTGATSSGVDTVTDANATWTATDVHQRITISAGFPAGVRYYIASLAGPNSVHISTDKLGNVPALATSTVASGVQTQTFGLTDPSVVGTTTGLSTNQISASGLTTDATSANVATPFTFVNLNTLVVGDTYHLVIWGENATPDAANYVVWMEGTGTGSGWNIDRSTDGSGYAISTANRQLRFTAYK